MFWDHQLHALIPNNPIVVRDLRHQQRTTSFWRGFIESVGVVTVALCFAVAMVLRVLDTSHLDRYMSYTAPLQVLAWIFHTASVLRFLSAGALIISDGSGFLDSDELRITVLSNWRILTGKWWAALHQIRGWMVALGIVQLGIVGSTAFAIMMTDYKWVTECGLSLCSFTLEPTYQIELLMPSWLWLVVSFAIVITILEAVSCIALGIFMAVIAGRKLGFVYAVVLRFLPAAIFAFYPSDSRAYGNLIWRFYEYTWFSFADSGTGALIRLTSGKPSVESGFHAFCAAIGMFLLYTSLSLVTAWAVMRRSRR